MTHTSGNFDSSASSAPLGGFSPFALNDGVPSNPFSATPLVPQSPFASMPDDSAERSMPEPGKPAKIPAPRPKVHPSPFEAVADPQGGFGFEAVSPAQFSPFTVASPLPSNPAPRSPFPSPFPSAPAYPEPTFAAPVAVAPAPTYYAPAPAPTIAPAPDYPSPAAAPSHSHHAPLDNEASAYRQLELRAIFGIDREMNADEIMQRTRSLPGVRNIVRIHSQEIASLDALKKSLHSLGLHAESLRLSNGHTSIDFFRHGQTALAVQVDGAFAPGIRETIMIVARELDKL